MSRIVRAGAMCEYLKGRGPDSNCDRSNQRIVITTLPFISFAQIYRVFTAFQTPTRPCQVGTPYSLRPSVMGNHAQRPACPVHSPKKSGGTYPVYWQCRMKRRSNDSAASRSMRKTSYQSKVRHAPYAARGSRQDCWILTWS